MKAQRGETRPALEASGIGLPLAFASLLPEAERFLGGAGSAWRLQWVGHRGKVLPLKLSG